jgi:hypothetical protein
MAEFERRGCFSTTMNIDGNHVWPGGTDWKHHDEIPALKNAVTTLTPLDPRYFTGVQVDFMERPFAFGYAGNAGGWIRSHFVGRLQKDIKEFQYRQRDDHPNSYRMYCDFLRLCKAVVSVPFTGSNATKHVKGRILEAGCAGAALMEWKNPATASWYTPRQDYWEYESIEEGIESAQYLVGHPKLCRDMAASLHHKTTTLYSAERIWETIDL